MQNPPQEAPAREQVAPRPSGLASATRRVAVLDHLRVPYRVEHDEGEDERLVVVRRPAASVCWPSSDTLRGATAGFWHLGDTVVAGRLLSDAAADEILGEGWDPVEEIVQEDGSRAASLWRSCEGRMFLPFDPDEVVTNLWSEAYAELPGAAGSAVKAAMRRVYYRLRPVMPRALQLSLRRRAVRFQRQARFPRWPIEPSLHDVLDLVLELLGDADDPVPWIAPWPEPYRWAVVLTHDVETGYGLDHLSLLRDIELEEGFRSSWNLVPRRYAVPDDVVAELTANGFEVGVHGLHHDGRDLESPETICRRLPEIRQWAERWGSVGFRAPATHRVWDAMPTLGFDYDSSYPDTDPFEPLAGGCCSWFPYTHGEMVELPITLPQDHTLYEILCVSALEQWRSKADAIRERGGMALLITHPDYMVAPERVEDYRGFLAHVSAPDAWRALPRDVCAWWRRRAASELEESTSGWTISGPAGGEGAVAQGPRRRVLT